MSVKNDEESSIDKAKIKIEKNKSISILDLSKLNSQYLIIMLEEELNKSILFSLKIEKAFKIKRFIVIN